MRLNGYYQLDRGDDGKLVSTDAQGIGTTLAVDDKKRWIDHVALGPDGAIAWSAGKTAFVLSKKGETRKLDLDVFDDQLLKLRLERQDVPFALFSEAIDRQAEQALFIFIQMVDANAWYEFKTKNAGSFEASVAVDDDVVATNQQGHGKAQRADRLSHFADVRFHRSS